MTHVEAPLANSLPETARFLIVEDDALTSNYIAAVLNQAQLVIAGSVARGEVAVSMATKFNATIALVDIKLLGKMNGIDVACALREQLGIPTIFLSGYTDAAIRESAQRARPLGFLVKPFLPSQLFNLLVAVFGPPPGSTVSAPGVDPVPSALTLRARETAA